MSAEKKGCPASVAYGDAYNSNCDWCRELNGEPPSPNAYKQNRQHYISAKDGGDPRAQREFDAVAEKIRDSTNELKLKDSGKALTYDEGKTPLAHMPWAALTAMSRVQAYGHRKYKDFNNYRKGMEVMRGLSCALRHIMAYICGQDNDPESGEPHLAHALCRIAFVIQNQHDGTAIDDRYKDAAALNKRVPTAERTG